MKVAIIGAGFTGLTAGYELTRNGISVDIFENSEKSGGTASGFKRRGWDWSLEEHYHHWFTNDKAVLNFAKELNHKYQIYNPKTSVLYKDKIYRFDNASSLLKFPGLSLDSKLKTGLLILKLKTTRNWKALENILAKNYIIEKSGLDSWRAIWEPLFIGKFSKYQNQIPASWFWARIKKRTQKLAYPAEGFQGFADAVVEKISRNGGKIYFKTKVEKIIPKKGIFQIIFGNGKELLFDRVIFTLATSKLTYLVKDLPIEYQEYLSKFEGIGAITLILVLKHPFFNEGTYWLNVNDLAYPFISIVEHTNLVNRRYYNNESIIYIGNYLPENHKYFKLTPGTLLKIYFPYLKRINKEFNFSEILDVFLFKSDFAQPIVTKNYSKFVPSFETPIKNFYLCNMQQVYPWDRGTNYAVENGVRVAELVLKSM